MIHANPQPAAEAQAEGKPTERPFVVEYYYTAKWGHADEFIRLFKKNHYPVLKKQVDSGRMLRVSAIKPRYHATEDGRWDYRVTIVFKNVEAAFAPGSDEEAIKKELFPDQETLRARKNAGSRSFRPTGTCRSLTSSSNTEFRWPWGKLTSRVPVPPLENSRLLPDRTRNEKSFSIRGCSV